MHSDRAALIESGSDHGPYPGDSLMDPDHQHGPATRQRAPTAGPSSRQPREATWNDIVVGMVVIALTVLEWTAAHGRTMPSDPSPPVSS